MKKFAFKILAVGLALTIVFSNLNSVTYAAVTKTAAPYNNEYVVLYNQNTSLSSYPQSAYGLPSTTSALAPASIMTATPPEGTKEIEEINGKTYYQIEPETIPGLSGEMPAAEVADIRQEINNPIASQKSMNEVAASTVGVPRTKTVHTFLSYDYGKYDETRTLSAYHSYAGNYCEIYVETSEASKFSSTALAQLAAEFDNNIKGFMETNFGAYYGQSFDAQGNKTGSYTQGAKIAILLEDIKDQLSYNPYSYSYMGGFFASYDISQTYPVMDGKSGLFMVHLDTNPLMKNGSSYNVQYGYSTLLHEFQHLINFSDYLNSPSQQYTNESWWNEAFSMAAEYMKYGDPSRITDFNRNDGNAISNGAVLNYKTYSDNNNSLAANYGMAFLFGQYLRTQTTNLPGGGNSIYKKILSSNNSDYRAVTDGLRSVGYGVTDFPTLNANFRIAMTLKEPTGRFGFMNEAAFKAISMPLNTGNTVTLKSGAAVVKRLANVSFTPVASNIGSAIKLIGFSKSAPGALKELSKIQIATLPVKTAYTAGENLDLAGLAVRAFYNNNTSAPITNYSVSGYNPNVVGAQNVILTYSEDGVTFSTSFAVTVKEAPITVKLSKTTLALAVKGTTTLKATVTPTSLANRKVTWKSSNTKVATVSSTGKVKAIGRGVATITATSATGKKTAKCVVTVRIPATSVTLNKKSATIRRSQTLTLKATVAPRLAYPQSLTWTSSNKAVATVSSKGVVKAIRKGKTKITAKTWNGKTVSCTITVK